MSTAAAVTPHHLATSAAIETMASGGDAIDAAIAANAVLGVVAPETCGVGGDLFALIHQPGQERPQALNASGRAGSLVSAQFLRDHGDVAMPLMGPESVTVPGCVDGWHHLARFGGRLSWTERLAPALTFAREGFPASSQLCRSLKVRREAIGDQPIGRYLLPGGVLPEPGQRLVRPDLAETLEAVPDRDSFLSWLARRGHQRSGRGPDLVRRPGGGSRRLGRAPRTGALRPACLDDPTQLPGIPHFGGRSSL